MLKKILIWALFLTLLTLPVASAVMASTDASCEIAVATSYGNREVTATVTWTTDGPHGWHELRWGDGTEVRFQGLTGSESFNHIYSLPDKYTLVFTTDMLDPDETLCVTEFTVDFSASEMYFLPLVVNKESLSGFFCKITSESGKTPNKQTATIKWSGAKETWWLLYWGDENKTHSEPPGFFGSSGTESFPHVYNSGIYTQKVVIENDDGEKYPCENTVTVP